MGTRVAEGVGGMPWVGVGLGVGVFAQDFSKSVKSHIEITSSKSTTSKSYSGPHTATKGPTDISSLSKTLEHSRPSTLWWASPGEFEGAEPLN